MLDEILAAEREQRFQLFRQLYDRCRQQHGEECAQTRMFLDLISQLEELPPSTDRAATA